MDSQYKYPVLAICAVISSFATDIFQDVLHQNPPILFALIICAAPIVWYLWRKGNIQIFVKGGNISVIIHYSRSVDEEYIDPQVIMFDKHGEIVDFLCVGSTLKKKNQEFVSTLFRKDGCSVDINLDSIPSTVKALIVHYNTNQSPLSSFKNAYSQLVLGDKEFQADLDYNGRGLTMAKLIRKKHGWKMVSIEKPHQDIESFGDVIPSLKRELKKDIRKIKINPKEKIAVVYKSRKAFLGSVPPVVTMGLSWTKIKGHPVDLDASCVVFTKKNGSWELLDACYFGMKVIMNGAVKHSGDDLTGENPHKDLDDNEQITLNMKEIAKTEAEAIVFTITSYSQEGFSDVNTAVARIFDPSTNKPLAVAPLANIGNCTGLVMVIMLRDKQDKWMLYLAGDKCDGKTYMEIMPQIMESLEKI